MGIPSASLAERVRRLLGAEPIAWRRAAGGYTAAERWIVTLADGRSDVPRP
jgi:hypothetical protein